MSESEEDLKKRIAELEAKLEEEKGKRERSVYLKVSAKGGASLYGIRRFPITFYVEEWEQILDRSEVIRKFIKDHEGELTRKT